MIDMSKVTEYVCNKFYYVIYKRDGIERRVEGLLLNYASGNIVLLSENGICHIRYKDIVFMKFFEPPVYRMSKEFKNLLESSKEDSKSPYEYMYDWAESYFKGAGDLMEYLVENYGIEECLLPSKKEDVIIEFAQQFGEVRERME